MLDGMSRIPKLISRAKELGMNNLAITDHGAMYGVINFYVAAKEAGIKPIIGCEIYVAEISRNSRSPARKSPYHLILLAKNEQGYRNLIQLVTKAHLEGFYYKPRVDKELLAQYHDGLIALSGCIQGELGQLILQGRLDDATAAALWYKETFNDYYLEIQRLPIPELDRINQELLTLSTKLDIPYVATSDVHYINKADASSHELLLCIQTNTSIYDEKRLKMAGDFFYLKSPEEMINLFADLPQAIENTCYIADMCQLELDFSKLHLPQVELPKDRTADSYLSELCWQGLKQRYAKPAPEIEQRLNYELEVIRKTQLADYFLVVWDIVSFAKRQNILYGVRGSAAASLVLYCLGITNIDPLLHNLVFERFLNVERYELPDIDLDFQDDRRDEIITYVSQKYGANHVAQIITFGTLGARAALRDVGRALGIPYGDVDRVARLVPPLPTMTLNRALEENKELYDIYYQDETVRNLIESAKKVEGIARHTSTHAAGIVISREPLTQYTPLQYAGKGDQATVMTQFPMENIARLGLLKLDILGLANLAILSKATELIRQNREISIDLQRIPLDDAKTFELLAEGKTSGVFQLEGAGMRHHIRELKPSTFNDIAAMVALYRPGPMEHIPTFIRAKHGLEPIRYPHPTLKEILEETYGVIVYQEQVLFIVQALAGYSLGQADIFRKAMGKKIPKVMKQERKNFINGAKNKGISPELADEVFTLIEPFAGYAFNKAHSVSYALIAYETAYLKANYSIEYMTALLNTHIDQPDKVRPAINECHHLDIAVLPPDINQSQAIFTIDKMEDRQAIRFGLTAIKNIGLTAIEPIVRARNQGGEFKSIEDFCRRADLRSTNKKALETLIKVGAFDCLANRGALLQALDQIISLAQRERRLRESGQTSMFDLWGQVAPLPLSQLSLQTVDLSPEQKLNWERELLGVYFSEHPLASVASKLASATTVLCGEIDASMVGNTIVTAGIVSSVRQLYTRDQRPFIAAVLEDLNGSIEATAFPKVYDNTKELWQEGKILLIEGVVRQREERVQLNCQRVRQYQINGQQDEESPTLNKAGNHAQPKHCLVINIEETDEAKSDIERVHQTIDILRRYPGQNKVYLNIINKDKTVNLELPDVTTNYCPELIQELTHILDEASLQIKELK